MYQNCLCFYFLFIFIYVRKTRLQRLQMEMEECIQVLPNSNSNVTCPLSLLFKSLLPCPLTFRLLIGFWTPTNGAALKYSRLLEDMATRGVKYLDCYGVDNALVSFSLESDCFVLVLIDFS